MHKLVKEALHAAGTDVIRDKVQVDYDFGVLDSLDQQNGSLIAEVVVGEVQVRDALGRVFKEYRVEHSRKVDL